MKPKSTLGAKPKLRLDWDNPLYLSVCLLSGTAEQITMGLSREGRGVYLATFGGSHGIDSRIETRTRIRVESGTKNEIENRTRVEKECKDVTRIKSVTEIGIENETGFKLTSIYTKEEKKLFYVDPGIPANINYTGRSPTRKCRTMSGGSAS
ncbi:hypothetical protein EVAR_95119_1 [Eumeta japonica]|uniref:Uncharacterized protein n=1 Tax=Eumeta variegata TaxID=151549 RepID=A0A4C1W7B0_EUMVA|nr:hypothetical protein EVAR_95119_1 [Eumeta japonica]